MSDYEKQPISDPPRPTPGYVLGVIPEQYRYLFENIEAEMEPIVESDSVIDSIRQRIRRTELSIETSLAREAENRKLVEAEDLKVEAAMSALKLAQRNRNIVMGTVRSEQFMQGRFKETINRLYQRISRREKQLIVIEAKKRLNKIGRTLRANVGRYRKHDGIGFNIVRIDGDHKIDGKEKVLPPDDKSILVQPEKEPNENKGTP